MKSDAYSWGKKPTCTSWRAKLVTNKTCRLISMLGPGVYPQRNNFGGDPSEGGSNQPGCLNYICACAQILWMDEMHFAPPEICWKDDCSVNANYGFPWFQSGAKWISSLHISGTSSNTTPVCPRMFVFFRPASAVEDGAVLGSERHTWGDRLACLHGWRVILFLFQWRPQEAYLTRTNVFLVQPPTAQRHEILTFVRKLLLGNGCRVTP